jgi:tetratricopeptide (TPR) repeat protein
MIQAGGAAGSFTVEVNWLEAVATAVATIAAIGVAYLTHRHNQKTLRAAERSDIERQVAKEVEAKVGSVLLSLRELESDARTQLHAITEGISARRAQLADEIEEREQTLRDIVASASKQASQIETLLQKAQELLPTLESGSVLPIQLLYAARSATTPIERSATLARILDHPDAEATTLESAGDMAREFGNNPLALRLYGRAFEIDPEAVSARAEYLALCAYSATQRGSAKAEITALAQANPDNETVLNALINYHIRRGDYTGLLAAARAMIASSMHQRLLWRNIAVALTQLERPHQEVVEAYQKALDGADTREFINAARPYANYLIERRDLDAAEDILRQAIRQRPSDTPLHRSFVDLYWWRRDYASATRHLALLQAIGTQADQLWAGERVRDMSVLKQLGWDDAPQGLSPIAVGALRPEAPAVTAMPAGA